MRVRPSAALARHLGQPANFGALEPDPSTAHVIAGSTEFAMDLYRAFRTQAGGNLLLSPYSIFQSLAMLNLGSAGQTAGQIATTMHLAHHWDDFPAALQKVNTSLRERGNLDSWTAHVSLPRALHSVNGLWGEQSLRFDPAYGAQLEEFFATGILTADFRRDSQAASKMINSWVARETNSRIQDIVPPGVITPDTQLVLVNALYFYGAWEYLFEEHDTRDGEFFRLDGTRSLATFMRLRESLPYAAGDGYQAIEFPYFGSQFALTVILPDVGQFARIEAEFTSSLLSDAIGTLRDRPVIAFLPKFEFEFATSLIEPLQTLGMLDAFDANLADFSGMLDASASGPGFLGQMLHKAFINVDENGTEASAATLSGVSFGIPPEGSIEIRIDRPFVFLIRDSHSGAILFIGRVLDPGESQEQDDRLLSDVASLIDAVLRRARSLASVRR